ncbi:MAG: hypothetical protein IH934_04855 [Nanoarchaeota archaeon]|nr:hypothetical protein [Nanoarchaeota archaeon]
MKKRKKKEKIKYEEPPMKYNIALHKFEVDLPTINKENSKKINYNQFNILIIILIIIATIYFIILKHSFNF